jgi:DNA-directed RNA polymerase specialized sigma24 family protein
MEEEIARAARQLVRAYDWWLITEDALAARVAERLRAPGSPRLDILCEQEAGALLFAACEHGGLRTATPTEQQQRERAFHDLANYLTAVACRLPPPAPAIAWDDLVQETLLEIHQKYGTCRQPLAFLGWAVTILKRKGAGTWRTGGREEPLPAGDGAEAALLERAVEPPSRQVDPAGDQEVLRVLHECLDTDEERLRVVWVFAGWKRRDWALVFDTSLARFDQLGVTVKRKLLRCPAFRALVSQPVPAR